MLVARLAQGAHERRRDPEEGQAMTLDELPEPARVGEVGRAVEQHDGAAERVGPEHQPGPHDPAEIRRPVRAVARTEAADVGGLRRELDEQPGVHVDRALRPSRRPRRVAEQDGVLALDLRRPADTRAAVDEVVVPDVAPLLPRDLVPETTQDDDVAERGGAGRRAVGGLLHRDGPPPARAGVAGDQHGRARVDQPARDSGGGEAREDRHGERAERRNGVERGHGLRHHRQQQRHGVALADPEVLEALRETRRLAGELGVRPDARRPLLALPDDGLAPRARGIAGEALDARGRQVEPPADEPARPLRPARLVQHLRVRLGERDAEIADHRIPEPPRSATEAACSSS